MIKRISLLISAIILTLTSDCQTNLLLGDSCFNKGNYTCAKVNYKLAFDGISGKEKKIAEIKLTRAIWCEEQITIANNAFNAKDYLNAKEIYTNILGSNPHDKYAENQTSKCDIELNLYELRKATTSDLEDIWNNVYGIFPERRQNLINAGIDPDDAQRRINLGEGKNPNQHEAYLSLSTTNLYFKEMGGVHHIRVETNASSFGIKLLPRWCKVHKNDKTFTITAEANHKNLKRDDWFKVYTDKKEIKVFVHQNASIRSSKNSSKQGSSNKKITSGDSNCFNCPKGDYPWGVSIGYTSKSFHNNDLYLGNDGPTEIQGPNVGIKYEPLFKYGFGIGIGLFYEFLSMNRPDLFTRYRQHVIYTPIHFEYRFNFSKYFNLFAFGGPGFDFISNSHSDGIEFNSSVEYGIGLRIGQVQFNLGQSFLVNNINDLNDFSRLNKKYKHLQFSVSYMF